MAGVVHPGVVVLMVAGLVREWARPAMVLLYARGVVLAGVYLTTNVVPNSSPTTPLPS